MEKIALIIIYNHQYNKNIEILERLYEGRFSNIYHLVPFYTGTKLNVIPVYENSFYFQGYVAQGLKSYFNNDYTHYFFIADDLILNPGVNEKNLTSLLKLDSVTCFLPEFIQFHERKEWWTRVNEAYHYQVNKPGIEARNQLPGFEDAVKAFKQFNLEIQPLDFNQIWRNPKNIRETIGLFVRDRNFLIRKIKSLLFHKKYSLSYPLIGSYSDIFVISSDCIKQFCHYCGTFAATRLFVEIAIPTAMVLSAKAIVNEKDTSLQGKALWTEGDYKILDKYNNDLNDLINNFPSNHLYLHPIKLSKWKYKT